jgi:hypothetical protein
MAETGGTKILAIVTICVMVIMVGLSGCFSNSITPRYYYKGAYCLIYFEEFEKDKDNETNKLELFNLLTHSFNSSLVYYNEEYIIIKFKNKLYMDQNIEINFLYANYSIEVIGGVVNTEYYQKEKYESESEARKKSIQVYEEDKKFLQEQISVISYDISNIYNINITSEYYEMSIRH